MISTESRMETLLVSLIFTPFGTNSRPSDPNKSKTVSDGLGQYHRDLAVVKSKKYSDSQVPDSLIEGNEGIAADYNGLNSLVYIMRPASAVHHHSLYCNNYIMEWALFRSNKIQAHTNCILCHFYSFSDSFIVTGRSPVCWRTVVIIVNTEKRLETGIN